MPRHAMVFLQAEAHLTWFSLHSPGAAQAIVMPHPVLSSLTHFDLCRHNHCQRCHCGFPTNRCPPHRGQSSQGRRCTSKCHAIPHALISHALILHALIPHALMPHVLCLCRHNQWQQCHSELLTRGCSSHLVQSPQSRHCTTQAVGPAADLPC